MNACEGDGVRKLRFKVLVRWKEKVPGKLFYQQREITFEREAKDQFRLMTSIQKQYQGAEVTTKQILVPEERKV